MKKIFFLIGQLSGGGAEWQCLLQANMLAESGFDVTLFTLSSKNDYLKRLGDKAPKLEIKPLCDISNGNKLSKAYKLLRCTRGLRKLIKRNPGVIVYSWLELCHTISFFSCFKTKSKLIWAIRNSYMSKKKQYRKMNLIIKINSIFSKYVNCLISNSRAGLEHYKSTLKYSTEQTEIIYNIIDDSFLHYQRDQPAIDTLKKKLGIEEKTIILSLSRITPQKNYDLVIKSIAKVIDNCPDAVFIFVGSGKEEYIEHLKEIANKENVSKHILWLGHMDDIKLLLCSCDIFLLTSLGEGFSNSLLEASAIGCLCVSSDVGDHHLLVPPKFLIKDDTEISSVIITALDELKGGKADQHEKLNIDNFSKKVIQKKINSVFVDYV